MGCEINFIIYHSKAALFKPVILIDLNIFQKFSMILLRTFVLVALGYQVAMVTGLKSYGYCSFDENGEMWFEQEEGKRPIGYAQLKFRKIRSKN